MQMVEKRRSENPVRFEMGMRDKDEEEEKRTWWNDDKESFL